MKATTKMYDAWLTRCVREGYSFRHIANILATKSERINVAGMRDFEKLIKEDYHRAIDR